MVFGYNTDLCVWGSILQLGYFYGKINSWRNFFFTLSLELKKFFKKISKFQELLQENAFPIQDFWFTALQRGMQVLSEHNCKFALWIHAAVNNCWNYLLYTFFVKYNLKYIHICFNS